MLVLSHRGYWRAVAEKNSTEAFARSFQAGFGTETDLRDCLGKLVISHDPPQTPAASAESFFGVYKEFGRDLPLALNVKADGLQSWLVKMLKAYSVKNCFVFDMAVPDALGWLRAGVPAFTRQSEYETHPAFYKEASGVWLDGFHGDWWDADVLRRHLDVDKQVCVVSPELHGRDPRACWDLLAAADFVRDSRAMICTDRPEAAREALGE